MLKIKIAARRLRLTAASSASKRQSQTTKTAAAAATTAAQKNVCHLEMKMRLCAIVSDAQVDATQCTYNVQ